MIEDEELAEIRKKKLEEMMRLQKEITTPKPVIIEVFTSPSCPHCPHALAMVKQLAVQMPEIKVVEVSTHTPSGYEKAMLYNVQAVPMIFINGRRAFIGAPPSLDALRNVVIKYKKERALSLRQ